MYLFTHKGLGMLGNLILADAGPGQTQISFEIAPGGDPDSAEWGERYELFHQVAIMRDCLSRTPNIFSLRLPFSAKEAGRVLSAFRLF
jgi:hypothetical protein